MAWWQLALILLVLVWLLQGFGTWRQMKHYRDVLGEISRRWSDGHVGVGNARSFLGRGVILLLVLAPDDTVRRLMVMEGRSIFAKFRPLTEYEGLSLEALMQDTRLGRRSPGRRKALEQAVAQIEQARASGEADTSPIDRQKLQDERS